MKRKNIIVLLILLLIVLVIGGIIFIHDKRVATNLENICLASGDGWAPFWGQTDCSGNKLSSDSNLVDEKGFTCYCHTPNTCWNGNACVPKKTENSQILNIIQ